ncbi:MAG: DNA primase [Tranquillimonas sp.]
MSLPPGFLDELRSRVSLAQVVGRKVMWDRHKSNQGKGDMWAPCPFHHEKTASFHVDDRKGFFYCFGCHAKGDAIGFVKDSENVGFMEAVEILAREVGLALPAPDPKARAKADRRGQLAQIMEDAFAWYRLQLATGQAREARDYLARRGLDPAAQERWGVGFAPARGGLFAHLTAKGHEARLVLDAGLCAASERGGNPYDRFRNRILFPIRDAQGRAMALGGRAMDPNDRAKYLNSPETDLFHKGRSLFNHQAAREAAGKGQPLIVAEGYMDVIALSEAGFGAAVAPLGTAITEDQLRLLWRIHDEPIIALDGDVAGLRAAMRVVDLALPLLEAGKSLRFAIMPQGKDPDDLVRGGGPAAMQKVLDHAIPMVRLLWQRETEGRSFDSPERKAALDAALRQAIGRIRDVSIRRHYGEDIKRLRWELFAPRRPRPAGGSGPGRWRGDGFRRSAEAQPDPATRASLLAQASGAVEEEMREAVILAGLLTHPALLPRFEDDLERLEPVDRDHAALCRTILRHVDTPPGDLRAAVEDELGRATLEKLFAPRHVAIAPAIRNPQDVETAATCLAEELAKLFAVRAARRELAEALEEEAADEGLTWRLAQAAEARHRAQHGQSEDRAEYETGPNGARMRREERAAFDDLLSRIAYGKTGGGDRNTP